jgi:hypothetical protein
MVTTIEQGNVAAGKKFLGSVISTLRESLRNPNDLQAGNLDNPTATALASFLVTVIRTDGDHLSQEDINAYLKELCQNANTSSEDQLIVKAAQIAFDELNPENTTTLSPMDIGAEASISGTGFILKQKEPPLEEQFAAALSKRNMTANSL